MLHLAGPWQWNDLIVVEQMKPDAQVFCFLGLRCRTVGANIAVETQQSNNTIEEACPPSQVSFSEAFFPPAATPKRESLRECYNPAQPHLRTNISVGIFALPHFRHLKSDYTSV